MIHNQFSNNHPVYSISKHNSTSKSSNSLLMVPCINCEELVNMEDTDKHSQRCTTVSKIVIAVGKSHQYFDEIDFKITRLKESLRKMLNSIKQKELPRKGHNEQTDSKFKYLYRACEIAESVVLVQSLGTIEERTLKDVEQELRILSNGYQGSLAVALYMERLHSLILQKLSVFKRQLQNYHSQRGSSSQRRPEDQKSSPYLQMPRQNNEDAQQKLRSDSRNSQSKQSEGSSQTTTKDQLKTLITEKKQSVSQIKNMAQIYQQQTQDSQTMINNVMNIDTNKQYSQQNSQSRYTISNQDVQRYNSPDLFEGRPTLITKFSGSQERSNNQDPSYKIEILTNMSSSQWGSEANYNEDSQQVLSHQSGDQLQRVFYSRCLNQKMQLPSNHPAQKIPVSVLFKEALQKNLPQTQWGTFISSALQNPYEYLDMNKIANYNNQKLVKNNLREMTQDSQFKNRLQQL